MDKKEMSERLCVLSDNEIVKRRKPLRAPLALMAAGILMLAANALPDGGARGDLKAALMLLGGAALLVGVLSAGLRLAGSGGIPYCPRTGKYLRYEELYFPKERMREVMRLCEAGQIAALRELGQSSVPAVVVAMYSTDDGRLTAYQPFEYVELEYRPLGEMKLSRS